MTAASGRAWAEVFVKSSALSPAVPGAARGTPSTMATNRSRLAEYTTPIVCSPDRMATAKTVGTVVGSVLGRVKTWTSHSADEQKVASPD